VNFRILILLLLGLTFNVSGQETTIINQYPDNGAGEQYRLQQSAQYTFVVNYYAPVQSIEDQVAEMLNKALGLYLDKSYVVSESNLLFTDNPSLMMSEMSSIVNQGLDLFQLPLQFEGFSPRVYEQLVVLSNLEWSAVEYELLGDNALEREEMLRYFINVEILNLKSACNNEISEFLRNKKAFIVPDAWANKVNQSDNIEEEVIAKREQFIAPLEFTLDEPTTSNGNDMEWSLPKSFVNEFNKKAKKEARKNRKKDAFSESVLALLEQNSEQLIAIQQDLVDFTKENMERDRELRNESNQQVIMLQSQINELKELVFADERAPRELNVFESSPALENAIILFEKNSAELNNHYKLELNKVYEVLLKNANSKIMITGYADKSGDPDFNAYISRKRANEVKSYLQNKGIPSNRMLVNYLGDINSTSENASDRRVVVEFITDVGTIDLSSN
jgi:outer membrane protein OmpA-like peptidoglycan-associated protein